MSKRRTDVRSFLLKLHILQYSVPCSTVITNVCVAQATYFDQKFHATFFLAPEEAGMERSPRPIGAALRDPTPPRTDPRGHSRMPSAAPANTAERQQSAEDASAAEDRSQMRGSISEPPQRRSSRFSAWQMADRGAEQLLSEPHQEAAAHNAVLHRAREPTEPQAGAAMQAKSSFHQPASGIASPQVQGQGGSWSHEEEELLDREVQDELLATIEEQEQALRSAAVLTLIRHMTNRLKIGPLCVLMVSHMLPKIQKRENRDAGSHLRHHYMVLPTGRRMRCWSICSPA